MKTELKPTESADVVNVSKGCYRTLRKDAPRRQRHTQLWQFLLELLCAEDDVINNSNNNNPQLFNPSTSAVDSAAAVWQPSPTAGQPRPSRCRQPPVVSWEGDYGEFRVLDGERLARLWGERKNRQNMTYDKLTRALRYYYERHIIRKVVGRPFCYRFDFLSLLAHGYSLPPALTCGTAERFASLIPTLIGTAAAAATSFQVQHHLPLPPSTVYRQQQQQQSILPSLSSCYLSDGRGTSSMPIFFQSNPNHAAGIRYRFQPTPSFQHAPTSFSTQFSSAYISGAAEGIQYDCGACRMQLDAASSSTSASDIFYRQ